MAYLKLLLHTAVCGTVHLPSLQQLSCDVLPRSAGKFLAAVTGSLTQLRITPEQEEDEDPPPGGTDVLARAVNRLTSLKCLQLGRYCCSREVLLALRELTCLTQLKLCDRYTSVRDVSSRQLGLGGWGDGNFLDLLSIVVGHLAPRLLAHACSCKWPVACHAGSRVIICHCMACVCRQPLTRNLSHVSCLPYLPTALHS